MTLIKPARRNRLQFVVVSLCLLFTGCGIDKQKHFVAGAAVSSWIYPETADRGKACLASEDVGIFSAF